MKRCDNCRHFRTTKTPDDVYGFGGDFCRRNVKDVISHASGEKLRECGNIFCDDMREGGYINAILNGLCGKSGRYWRKIK